MDKASESGHEIKVVRIWMQFKAPARSELSCKNFYCEGASERALNYQFNWPPTWYSVTRVSKKFFSFDRSIASDIQGNGF